MPDRTADEAYATILSALREHGLSWVAEQIQDHVRAGKPTTRVVAPTPSQTSIWYAQEALAPRRPRSERLAATEPYTPAERVSLALQALERAVIETADLEDEILKFSHVESKAPVRTIFEPEELEDAERREFGVVPTARRQAVAQLRQAVEALRREAERGDH